MRSEWQVDSHAIEAEILEKKHEGTYYTAYLDGIERSLARLLGNPSTKRDEAVENNKVSITIHRRDPRAMKLMR